MLIYLDLFKLLTKIKDFSFLCQSYSIYFRFHRYVEKFVKPDDGAMSEECKEHLMAKPVFLPRSVRSYNFSPYGKARSAEAMLGHNKEQSIQENHIDEKQSSNENKKDATDDER